MFSPRQWRCFSRHNLHRGKCRVFSTPVEVFLAESWDDIEYTRFLHASGGVSFLYSFYTFLKKFSPRQWRCFQNITENLLKEVVFSTPVEVFLFTQKILPQTKRFLHASGGVSLFSHFLPRCLMFSPRQWRCFFTAILAGVSDIVFSTPVEVFLIDIQKKDRWSGLRLTVLRAGSA